MHKPARFDGLPRAETVRFYIVASAVFPLFLMAEAFHRLAARFSRDDSPGARASSPVFAEAWGSCTIAISYALMARKTLRSFARKDRTERLS